MARVRNIEIEDVPEEARDVYRRFANEFAPFLNQARVFAQRPTLLKHVMGMLLDLKDESPLPKRYLEIALVTVSKLSECTYCVAHHTPRLVDQGLGAETAARILEPDCPGLDNVDRLVRDYAVQVSTQPGRIRDDLFDKLRAHFSEPEIVELTWRAALCGAFNRFNDALAIEMEDGVVEDMLAKGGREEDLPRAAKKAAE